MIFVILIFLLLLFLTQCTTINVFTTSKAKKSVYNKYPYLKDGAASENYIIKYISNPYKAFITYDTKNKYFFIAQPPYRKISKNGLVVVQIEDNGHLDNPLFTHYLFDKDGVYDFSKTEVKKELFNTIINADFSMRPKQWKSLFDDYYKKADVVVYGNDMDYKYYPIYLKINTGWILIFSSSYDGFNQSYSEGVSLEGYPAKFNKMVLLKDNHKQEFSNGMVEENLNMDEYSLSYPSKFKLRRLYFHKQMVSEDFPYTSIPQEFSGIAYYRIKIDNDVLNFKESALKHCFSSSVKSYLFWYVLPEKYLQDSKVSFLEYKYPHNINETGSNGLYIIKEK